MYSILRAILFLFPPEKAHHLALGLAGFLLKIPGISNILSVIYRAKKVPVSCLGFEFENPVGLAAGFDKNARHTEIIEALGFGFIEIGSVTHRGWLGNPQPRLFRLKKDEGLINRMGLNNEGAEAVAARLKTLRPGVPLFVNVAKTPDKSMNEAETIQDYCESVRKLKPYADVMVLNISCPNADGGRTFEDPALLRDLLTGVRGVLEKDEKPLLIKLSPDLSRDQLEATFGVCESFEVDGYTATNTTTHREGLQASSRELEAIGMGGMSGRPLHDRAVEVVRHLRSLTQKPIVGVGGVSDCQTAQDFIDAGATLVQAYSGFIYRGPAMVQSICEALVLPQLEDKRPEA